jgi:hypothetical protein
MEPEFFQARTVWLTPAPVCGGHWPLPRGRTFGGSVEPLDLAAKLSIVRFGRYGYYPGRTRVVLFVFELVEDADG